MSRFLDDIRQVGYVVPDLDAALDFYVNKAGIGPWFVAEKLQVTGTTYRGEPLELQMSIALANSGETQMELIQQLSPAPSIYTEFLAQRPQGDLPHHYSSWSNRYDEVLANADALGFERIQEGRSGMGPFVYLAHPDNPTFIYEVTDFTPPRRAIFDKVRAAAVDWDGSDPIRYGW